MNRCIRDPYVQWCESLSLSAFAGGAGYSITSWCSFCRGLSVHCLRCIGALAWWLFWIFLFGFVRLQKIQMCHQMGWLNVFYNVYKVFQFISSVNCPPFVNHKVTIIISCLTSPKSAKSYFGFCI